MIRLSCIISTNPSCLYVNYVNCKYIKVGTRPSKSYIEFCFTLFHRAIQCPVGPYIIFIVDHQQQKTLTSTKCPVVGIRGKSHINESVFQGNEVLLQIV